MLRPCPPEINTEPPAILDAWEFPPPITTEPPFPARDNPLEIETIPESLVAESLDAVIPEERNTEPDWRKE